jgi:hypothetical protein
VGARRGLAFPLTRIGLLVVVGSLAASALQFYVSFAGDVSDLSGRDVALDRKSLWAHFTRDFLFSGGAAGVLFWVGLGVLVLGILRNVGVLGRQ